MPRSIIVQTLQHHPPDVEVAVAVFGLGVDIPKRLAELVGRKGLQLALSVEAARRAGVSEAAADRRAALAAKDEAEAPTELIAFVRSRDIVIGAAAEPLATQP